MLITFDGPNGAGKTTIIEELKRELELAKYKVHITEEPTNSKLGLFLRKSEEDYSNYTLANLVAADRHEHIQEIIVPKLDENYIVLCDRYIVSSLILQRLDGLENNEVMSINTGIIKPDLCVLVTACEKTLNERLKKRNKLTRFEREFKSADEIRFTFEAEEFLADMGYEFLTVNTDEDLRNNITRLFDMIKLKVGDSL